MKSCLLTCVLVPFLGSACSTVPAVRLSTDGFPLSKISVESYREGQQIGDESLSPLQRLADSDMTIMEGQWTASDATEYQETGTYYGAQKHRWWSVEIYDAATASQRKAIMTASDGYDAKLGQAINASLRICPRFERKSFSWGQAVSFLAQYQNDNTNYVPNNGMLTYEVHGFTEDGRYVRARFGVTHPNLVEFGPDVRDHRNGDPANPTSPMRKDPHYRLVEKAPPGSFEPSLSEIDRFLDTLETNKW